MEQVYNALRTRILSHALDPYLLTDATLKRITALEEKLRAAAVSGCPDTAFRALCTDAAGQLRERCSAAQSVTNTRREMLSAAYDSILQGTSRLLSENVFKEVTTVWFTHPGEEELRALEESVSSLISICETAQKTLLEPSGLKEPPYTSGVCSNELLALRIVSVLCSDILPSTCDETLEGLSPLADTLEGIEDDASHLRDVGMRIAADLLPPFLKALDRLLTRVNARLLEASDVLRILTEAQALRIQMRQAAEPLRKI